MTRTAEELALCDRFAESYRRGRTATMQAIERAVYGCDYGGTSYATRQEADDIGAMLALRPGQRLLEVGAGSGWPALYLADRSGCDVTLTDLPLDGLRIAGERAVADGIAGACWIAVADGGALPFAGESFDAVTHSDVLCCLDAKRAVLEACRRVIRPGGTMVFSVISITPGLSPADHRQAREIGPPYVETETAYPAMLERTGWRVADRIDLTAAYLATVERFLAADQANAAGLEDLLGAADYAERLDRDHQLIDTIGRGLYLRELFHAAPIVALG